MSQVSEKAVSFEPEEKRGKEWKINVFAMLLTYLSSSVRLLLHIYRPENMNRLKKMGIQQ